MQGGSNTLSCMKCDILNIIHVYRLATLCKSSTHTIHLLFLSSYQYL